MDDDVLVWASLRDVVFTLSLFVSMSDFSHVFSWRVLLSLKTTFGNVFFFQLFIRFFLYHP